MGTGGFVLTTIIIGKAKNRSLFPAVNRSQYSPSFAGICFMCNTPNLYFVKRAEQRNKLENVKLFRICANAVMARAIMRSSRKVRLERYRVLLFFLGQTSKCF